MSDTFDHEADAWDSLLFGQDEDGEDVAWDGPHAHRIVRWGYIPRVRFKTCRYCGKGGFVWINTPDGWRLGCGGQIHSCAEYGNRVSR